MKIEIKKSIKPVNYIKAIKYLEKRLDKISKYKAKEFIWILEHPSIYTAGSGFDKKDIEVEVADGVLTIRSVKESSDESDEWTLHRVISSRKFNRKFTLADDIVVNDAKLKNGLLTISLEQIVPEEKKPKLIEVK